ncbi:hypothetical protein BGZ83_011399, partial [Gryganskiella cystojenkinii]
NDIYQSDQGALLFESTTADQEFSTVHFLFELQVKCSPDAVALVHEGDKLTYAELNAQSNSLAHRLIELGVRVESRVAICVGRSISMVVGILAILKAGGAYIPLDPTYPRDRLKSILDDSLPSIMVIDEASHTAFDQEILCSSTLVDPNTSSIHQTTNPHVPGLTSQHLAYIMYTSGSTGRPKGVMVEHRGVANLAQYHSTLMGVDRQSRFMQFASMSFDVSVLEIFVPITSGATVYLAPDAIRIHRDKLWDYIIQHSISFVTCTPSFLRDGKDLPTWTSKTTPLVLMLGGEALGVTLLQNLLCQGITVFNDYGPTEASISSLTWKSPEDYTGDEVPIGQPVRNARVYLLDDHKHPVPVGAIGEIYISGVGVARGYLNQPKQTAERFLLDPFSDQEGTRMYRTGDLARYLPDGNLVYLGRSDDQVKIRGFRIELGEIEACLQQLEWVSEAVVSAVDSGDQQQLVAYVVSESQDHLRRRLRSHLASKLPPYMVPAAYVRLDAMPLTANDKLDRKALPTPDEGAFSREIYEEPRGDIEQKLAVVWTELLQIKNISRHDNFFALGGHSLLAAKMLDYLRHLDLTVSLRELFECPTLSALAQAVTVYDRGIIPPNAITPKSDALTPEMLPLIALTQSDINLITSRIPGGLSNIQDIYSLSPMQEGILFHHLLASEGDPYLLTSTIAFESRTLLDRYLTAFQTVVDRHDILRTAFLWDKISTSAQVVYRNVSLPVEELYLDPEAGDIMEQLDSRFNPKHYRIELSRAPLLRFIITRDADDRWLLVQLIHHLIGDHDAEEEMHVEIKALLDGQGDSLPKPRPFRDHLAQVRLTSSPEDDENFFRGMLEGITEPTLPFGLTKVDNGRAQVKESHQVLSQDLNDRLRSLAKQLRVNLATLCHVAWAQVLARTSGQQQVVFATVLSGRLNVGDGSGHAFGLLMNTLPFRCDIDKRSALGCVQDTYSRLTALLEHENASLALAQRCSSMPTGTPLFSGLLNYRHSPLPSTSVPLTSHGDVVSQEGWFQYPGVQFLSSQERTNYPLSVSVDDFGTKIGLTAEVLQPLDPGHICGYMQEALSSLARALELTPHMAVEQLEVLSTEERQLLLKDWNATEEDYSDQQCLHQLFEQQVDRTPDAIALVHGDQSLTYAELNLRANSLAHRLIALGVKPDTLVAICVERSFAMIVGILAILKAGGAYVPLDPYYASDRLKDILRDAAPVCVVADIVGRMAIGDADLSSLTVVDPNDESALSISDPIISTLTSRHLAYVIFTSGTTGKPKGVMIEHQGVVSYIMSQQQILGMRSSSRMIQFCSIGFDVSVLEIFGTLCCGGGLHLIPGDVCKDGELLWGYLERHCITHATLTPSVLQDCKKQSPLSTLSTLLVGGEVISNALVQQLFRLVPNGSIVNMYGPTETIVDATSWKCSKNNMHDIVPIGRPLPNKTIYLLDTYGNPVPLGAIGEMYIGGVGVARGYLNRSQLTAERFLPDPFADQPGARMYKTGDLAQYLPDGNLVFLGRNDHQVKIRGFRIELGEIETRLSEHPLVSEAVVIALGEGSNKRLVAYVIAQQSVQLAQATGATESSSAIQLALALRSFLETKLPDYMVPAAFVQMNAFPLTANGKLDQRALPNPGDNDYAHQCFEEPHGEVECALASIWSDLLDLERVSRHDNFFALGGHSLLAVQMISRLNSLGHLVSVRTLFESPILSALARSLNQYVNIVAPPNAITLGSRRITPEMLPLIELEQADIDRIVELVPGGAANIQDIYALSPLQDGIFFHHLKAKNGDPYILYNLMSFNSKGSLDRYLGALQQIVNRHDILRTAFVWQNTSMPAQVVWRQAQLSISEHHLDPAAGPIATQLKQMFDPRSHRMDLTQAPLLRFAFSQESDDRWILIELLHHLISDHSTLETMQFEAQAIYKGHIDTLPPAQPYRNLIAQARLGLTQEHHERFFKEMLVDIDTPSLPFGLTDVHGDGIQITEAERMLSQDLNNRIRTQARRLGVSVASLCHVAWAQVIARTSGEQRVVFGTVLFGRMQAAGSTDRAMGLFINTLPIRVDLDQDSVEDSVRATHTRLAALLEHEHASLALAQRCSSVGTGIPLFSALMNYRHNLPTSDDDIKVYGMEYLGSDERTNYPFGISMDDYGTSLGFSVQVVQSLDAGRVCDYMHEALHSMTKALERTPTMPVAQLEVLPTDERRMLLKDWNAAEEDYPDQHCLHQLFEQQVDRTPDAIALVHGDQSLTYSELNLRANSLAHRLIALGVKPDTLVAICVERSFAMIVGILAILKAGGAYVPLDPYYASDRLKDILSDAAPTILLADHAGRDILSETSPASVVVLDPTTDSGRLEDSGNPQVPGLDPLKLVYVMYTSGSTGNPKGVMVEHRMIVRAFDVTAPWFHFNESHIWSMFHSFGFDISVWEMWGALRYGGKLVVVPQHITRSPQEFYRLLCENDVTVLNQTPSAFNLLVTHQEHSKIIDSLQYVILAGEALVPSSLLPWYVRHAESKPQIVNMYGPTETFYTTYRPMMRKDCSLVCSPIGARFPDLRFYVLDKGGQPIPLGATGELYIGGAGVSRGYWNRPDLAAEKFIIDPFVGQPGARMYKTGDLVRYLIDGDLVYVGRSDDQIKMHGFRIELGEIETRLSEHPLVSEAVVIALGEGSDKQLVAYVIAQHSVQLAQASGAAESSSAAQLALTLRSFLATKLPNYMVPAAFMQMNAFPLTANGKLDRRALPNPGDNDYARQCFEEPHGEVEMTLASIWAELLNVERVGRHDSFFALGGHSLLAVRLINRLSKLGTHISLSSLFDTPTLAALATVITESISHGTSSLPAITLVPRDSVLPLSFAQQRLWFLTHLEGGSEAYHIPSATHLRGYLNQSAWKQSWDELYARHEALRSVISSSNGQPQVHILPPEGLPMRLIDLRDETNRNLQLDHCIDEDTRKLFDLAQGPLIRLTLIQLGDEEHISLLTLHHIISDGWSSGIILSEISQLYKAYCNGEPSPLTPLAIQYPDYASWQRQWLSGDRLQAQSEYWRTMLSGAPALIDLPTDRPRPSQQSFEGDHIPIALDSQITTALNEFSRKHGVTMFMTILSAWSVVLSRLSGQDDIVIGTPSANRSRQEIEPLIGLFVNTLAMRIDLSGEPSTKDLLDRVRRHALAAYAHQDLPFEQVVEIVQPPRRMNHTPLFQVMFVWQNNEEGQWDLPGLQLSPYELDHDTAKFDLTLALWESGDGIEGNLGFATSLFDRSTIERHIGYLLAVLPAMVSDVDRSLATVDIMSAAERSLLLHTWNDTREDYPDHQCLHQLFEQQVERTPDAIALVHGDQSLTYAELNLRANSLAHRLIALGVKPDTLVAICVERSLAMILGVLAILKAGGAYVPLDPYYASDRLKDILNDAAPTILLADLAGRDILGETTLVNLTVVDPNTQVSGVDLNPQAVGLTSRHLAYVIYTSGSTGRPKGVMLEHQGAVNLVYSRPILFDIHPDSRVLQNISLGFDHSVSEIFSALRCGSSLHLIRDDIRLDRHLLWGYLERQCISHISFTPTLLQDFKELLSLNSLRVIVVMGEPVPSTLLEVLRTIAPCCTIINEYGPTETSIATSVWKCPTDLDVDTIPIGRPLPNKTIYLLDTYGNPVPLGVIGEMHIGGVGVARGYLNRSQLTAERFLPDPFADQPGARMYKTSDLARYLPDGNLVFLGRNDHQVKIRGFRIELGEIETRLSEHPLVSEAVIIALGEGSDKQLVAYVIAQHSIQLAQASGTFESSSAAQLALTLRSFLATKLPDYMVPAAFVQMITFPLTPNGKLDRDVLPAPQIDALAIQSYEQPKGEIENILSSTWGDLLGVEKVGRCDDFFALGGHSLLAMRMIGRIRSMLGFGMSLRTLFEAPTIAELAPRLLATGTAQEESYEVLLPIKPKGSRPPLFCIHPGTGLSWCYTGLSTRLDPDQPLYGLQARGFIRNEKMASTLDEMVFDYIDQVCRIQPHGPYHLLGYSIGGVIAHAMASYLEKQGECVALVALMDTRAIYHDQLPAQDDDLEGSSFVEMLIGNKEQYPTDLINPFLEKMPLVSRNNSRIGRSQEPHILNSQLLIFRATVLRSGVKELWSPNEWKPYVLGEIEVCDVDCEHDYMDLPEPTAIIGRVLSQKLNILHGKEQ